MSLKGRITIIKALVLPQILFLFNLIYVPNEILDQINKEFFNFLWRNKPPKIKKETIIGQLEDGGLKMIDVYNMHVAAKCSWIRRLVSNENGSWKKLFYKMLSINRNMLNKKIGPFKTLGIWFSKNPKEMVTLNFNKRIEDIKKYFSLGTRGRCH